MKIQRILILCTAAFAMVFSPAMGQDQKLIPTPPYLARVPDSAHWTVILSYPSAPPATPGGPKPAMQLNADQPLTIDNVRGGGVSVTTFTFQNSPPVRINGKGTYSFLPSSKGPLLYYAGGQFPISFYTTTFLFAEWLRHEGISAFDKMEVYHGVPCFHYVNKQPAANLPIFDPGYGDEVWVSVKTMLPVASKWNGVEADFNFLPPPGSPPELSRDESNLIQYTENINRAIDSIR